MEIIKICEICGNEFKVPHWRSMSAKYCSRECHNNSKHGELNCTCTYCGKKFHLKKYKLENTGTIQGHYCSRNCMALDRQEKMKGSLNHQFGLKGCLNSSYKGIEIKIQNHNIVDIMVYSPNHPYCDKNSRVKKHRLLVEENYLQYPLKYFIFICNKYYLKPEIDVHHLDGNHDNNSIENLIPCTKQEHKQYHKSIITKRDNLGRIVNSITAVVKREELLESPEEDNQQPSLELTIKEGSETNS